MKNRNIERRGLIKKKKIKNLGFEEFRINSLQYFANSDCIHIDEFINVE